MTNTHTNIEVELRGPLSTVESAELISFLDQYAEKTNEKDRVLIDYSTFLPGGISERKKDIRLRVTNGTPEIIVKLGAWGENEQRKDAPSPLTSPTQDL